MLDLRGDNAERKHAHDTLMQIFLCLSVFKKCIYNCIEDIYCFESHLLPYSKPRGFVRGIYVTHGDRSLSVL